MSEDDWQGLLEQVLDNANQREAVTAALLDDVEPVTPPKTRLLEQVRSQDRMTWFAPQLAELYDLSLEDAQKLITQIRSGTSRVRGPGTGVALLPVMAGPKASSGMTAILIVEPGGEFPSHRHYGPEKVLVLEGAYRDSAGNERWRGEWQQSAEGSEHSVTALGSSPCICAVLC